MISRSEVWAAHFSSEATFCDQETVKVEDASFEAFQKLLQWVHGTCPQLTSLAVVFDLMYLAEKYLLKDLQSLLLRKIKEHLSNTPSHAFSVSELNRTNNEKVLNLVLGTVDINALPLILDPQQLDLDFATVSLVLARPSLSCDENRLARWLLAWTKHNQPDHEQASQLSSLIKWEMLTSDEVKQLLARPEACLMGPRFPEEVALRRLNHCHSEIGGIQRTPSMRSQTEASDNNESKRVSTYTNKYVKFLAIPVCHHLPNESPNSQKSHPLLLCPDGDTLIRPIIFLTNNCADLMVEILIVGSMGGLKDTSVMRREDYYRHVCDLQLELVLAYVAGGGWTQADPQELDSKNKASFRLDGDHMQKDLLSGSETFNGVLKIFQYKGAESEEEPGWSSDGTESEGEGDVLRDFSAEEGDEDWYNEDEDNGADLEGFIVDDSEDEEPVENEVNDHEEELDNSEVEGNSDTELQSSEDEDLPAKIRTKRQRMIYSDSEDEPGVKQKTRDCEKERSETDDEMNKVNGETVHESSGKTQKSNNEKHEEIDQDASSQTKSFHSADEDSAQLDDDVVTQVGGNWKVTQIHGN